MDYGLLKKCDADDGTGTAEGSAGIGINAVEHGGTLISTGRKINREFGVFDLAANGDTAGFIDEFTGIVTGDLYNLRVIVHAFIDDHQVTLRSAVLEYGRGVHGNVNHSFLHLFVQTGDDGVLIRFIPAAFNSTAVIHKAAVYRIIHCGLIGAAASEQKQSKGDYEQDENNQPCGLVGLEYLIS